MTVWRKSSYSGGSGGATDCVELARLPDGIGMRDSRNPAGPILRFGRHELAALLSDLKPPSPPFA
jgi:hypothetical protein